MNGEFKPLTRHPLGSVRELASLTLPLLLSAISGGLMFFLDRLILAHYDHVAMNAVVAAGTVTFIFHFSFCGVTGISEVLVGRHNGSKAYDKIGQPVWQMIWFSIMSLLIYIPVGIFAGPWLIPAEYYLEGLSYYHWMMFGGICFPLVSALTGFYIGRGKTRWVLWLNLLSNLVNLTLDVILVFGVDPYIPAMGATGAAIGTVAAQMFLVAGLAYGFFRPSSRRQFNSFKAVFNWPVFKDCLHIGLPNAVSHSIELAAHLAVIHIVASASPAHMTVFALGQSFFILFAYVTDSLAKGGMSVASNFIGGRLISHVPKSFISMLKLHGIFTLIVAIPFLLFPEQLVELFLSSGSNTDVTPEVLLHCKNIFFWLWIYFAIDGVLWLTWAILTAAGDTISLMLINIFNVWVFDVLLIYLVISVWHASALWIWPIMVLYAIINAGCYLVRYYSGAWKKMIELEPNKLLA